MVRGRPKRPAGDEDAASVPVELTPPPLGGVADPQ